ncbi:MAG TPA: CCA tRNA nucleotidyltransferase [Beijerinckiaceae bacterium]|nr:CCA tRNA nucleotidyltransferase [Beijerinckiaceae bacterium]
MPEENSTTAATGPALAGGFLDDPKLRKVLAALDGSGEETRVVGGAVRNALLGAPVTDIDLATTAVPATTIARAKRAGIRAVPTGIAHGTVTLVVEGTPFEVTTLREDIETDGRRATVRFGRDFVADALRRDFTINALSVGRDGTIFDYAGGLADLAERRIRFIGEPRARIREDYLRILRFLRFHAAFGEGPMDRAAFAAIVAERDGLALLSRERVRAELLKLVVAPRAAEVAADAAQAGLLGPLFGGVAYPARLGRYVAVEAGGGTSIDALARLAALGVVIVEDAERLRERLRLANDEADRLARAAAALADLHGRDRPPQTSELRVLLFRHGRRASCDGLALAQAESSARPDDPAWLAARHFLAAAPEPRLPVKGADFMARGLPSGRAVGQALKRLQALWIRAGFPEDPAELARLMDAALAETDEG